MPIAILRAVLLMMALGLVACTADDVLARGQDVFSGPKNGCGNNNRPPFCNGALFPRDPSTQIKAP
ncbi:hypothetical protein [Rhodovastum atsumiense]|uniref:Lipoprotein n=1 Tax=Rhodovastum atsumiense TaxID=504468 RepID=A0A5M6J116_9PROT|nr:hypothetical protein [Rhodovastum atsumiense]KAA5614270.1 hypothetical protein F1189_01345 [Rhodovastum atsumiense]